MNTDQYMKIAIEEAREGIQKRHGGPFGCVIVKDGRVIGRGHNQVLLRRDPTCHGEIEAIRDACAALDSFDLSDCELYTTGEPCPMCRGAILWANIEKVYFGCTVEDAETIGFRDRRFCETMRAEQGDLIPMPQVREACLALYEEYLQEPDRVPY